MKMVKLAHLWLDGRIEPRVQFPSKYLSGFESDQAILNLLRKKMSGFPASDPLITHLDNLLIRS